MVRRDETRLSWLALAAVTLALLLPGCSVVSDRLLTPDRSQKTTARMDRSETAGSLDLMPPGRARRGQSGSDKPPTAHGGEVEHVSPDGRWVAVETGKGASRAVSVGRRDTDERRRISGGHAAAAPSWAPDSSRLVFSAREFHDPDVWVLWLYDVSTGAMGRVGSAGGARPPAVAWFPDGQRICYGEDDRLVMINTATRQTSALDIPDHGRVAGTPAVSPDGHRLVFAVAGAGAWVASVEDGRFSRFATERDVDALAWAPGGREVALRTASDGRWQVRVISK